ncbi:MAG TPA: DUF6677 family protein [Pyrinomonadaceae bacterium]|nr:DUF6677 family protein [Pyrinomonadaceae bacterium]
MGKSDKEQSEVVESAPPRAWLMGVAGWLFPGLGHALQGRWIRALILGGAVWVCFLAGVLMGGHLFIARGDEQGSSALMQVPPMIANLGAGLLYIFCWFFGIAFSDDAVNAARATFEYGNTFLLVAGLLNYLSMLDAFDIAAGRKS